MQKPTLVAQAPILLADTQGGRADPEAVCFRLIVVVYQGFQLGFQSLLSLADERHQENGVHLVAELVRNPGYISRLLVRNQG